MMCLTPWTFCGCLGAPPSPAAAEDLGQPDLRLTSEGPGHTQGTFSREGMET